VTLPVKGDVNVPGLVKGVKKVGGGGTAFVLPPRSPLNLIAAVAPVGIAGVAGVYVPGANLKLAPNPLDGGLMASVNSLATCVNFMFVPGAGVGI
jgi:hypothetical protein